MKLSEARGYPVDLARADHPTITLEVALESPESNPLSEARGYPMAPVGESRVESLANSDTLINTAVTGLGSSETHPSDFLNVSELLNTVVFRGYTVPYIILQDDFDLDVTPRIANAFVDGARDTSIQYNL